MLEKPNAYTLVGFVIAAGAVLAARPAQAISYEAVLVGYCQYIAPGGGDQPFTLAAPIPAGASVHVGVITSAAVTLVGVSDVAGSTYQPLVSGSSGDFTGTLLFADATAGLPAGDSIDVTLAATGGGGTSCIGGFYAQGVTGADAVVFAADSSTTPTATTAPLQATGELAHVLLFGEPTGTTGMDPIATRLPPLVADGSVCVGTSSGRLCYYGSHALLDAAAPLEAAHDLSRGMVWGELVATFVPEPTCAACGWIALVALAALRRA